jgi:hypothetical protein
MILVLLIGGALLCCISIVGLAWQVGKRQFQIEHLKARIDAYEGAVDMFREAHRYCALVGDVYTANVFHNAALNRVLIARGSYKPVDLQA